MEENVIMTTQYSQRLRIGSYKRQWSVWLPGTAVTKHTSDINYKREELTAVYLGCRMSEDNRMVLLESAAKLSPKASVYHAKKSEREFILEFEQIV
jgi:hypothetical protein